jgi:hypothetical protein
MQAPMRSRASEICSAVIVTCPNVGNPSGLQKSIEGQASFVAQISVLIWNLSFMIIPGFMTLRKSHWPFSDQP